jgi:hypothetical protein
MEKSIGFNKIYTQILVKNMLREKMIKAASQKVINQGHKLK